jgi:hypothetical protein
MYIKMVKRKSAKKQRGGFPPLLGLLPAILGGLGAAGGLAGGISTAVKNAKEIKKLEGKGRKRKSPKRK